MLGTRLIASFHSASHKETLLGVRDFFFFFEWLRVKIRLFCLIPLSLRYKTCPWIVNFLVWVWVWILGSVWTLFHVLGLVERSQVFFLGFSTRAGERIIRTDNSKPHTQLCIRSFYFLEVERAGGQQYDSFSLQWLLVVRTTSRSVTAVAI